MQSGVQLKEVDPAQQTISAEEIHEGRDVSAKELPFAPREYQQLIIDILGTHAAGEAIVLNNSFSHWAADAPTAKDRFTVLRTIEEELMHALEGWRMLRQIQSIADTTDLVPYQESIYEGFRNDITEWAELAALHALTDRVGCFQQEEQLDCSYLPYAASIRTAFFPVEKGHAGRGRYWLQQLCETPDGLERAQRAVEIWWPRALDMFGRSDGKRQHRFIYYRLKKRTNEGRREAYIETVSAELEAMNIKVPDPLVGRKFL